MMEWRQQVEPLHFKETWWLSTSPASTKFSMNATTNSVPDVGGVSRLGKLWP